MNPAQLLAHFDCISEVPNAIPRFRRFILDLAVRGKLVEQDPRDETAADLLKRIQAEKIRLVKAGEIRTPRELEASDEKDAPFPLPTGWAWCRLSEIGAIIGGGTPPSGDLDNFTDGGLGVAWLTPADLGKRIELYVSYGARDLTQQGLRSSSATVMPKGSVLFTSRAPIGYTAIAANEVSTNQGFKSVVPYILDCNLYIAVYFRAFAKWIDGKASGTTFREVSGKIVGNLPFPLPPIAEQHRIVAKVDELMVLCDRLETAHAEQESRRDRLVASSLNRFNNGADPFRNHVRLYFIHLPRLTTRSEHIQQLRQTILNLAIQGKLVPQDPNDEPASELVIRARQSRREAWEAGHTPKQLAQGKNRDNLMWKAKYELPKRASREPEFDMPGGWEWVAWREIGVCQNGRAFPSTEYSDSGIRLLRPGNLFVDGSVVWTTNNTRFLPERWEKKYPGFVVGESEIVMNLTAQSLKDAFLGRACLTRTGDRCLLNQRIARLTSYATTPRYTLWLLKSLAFRNYVDAGLNQGSLIQHMFTAQVDEFEFPLPPLAEQHRIVAKVEELMALCDRLEAQLTTTQTVRRLLLESVLHEALAGQRNVEQGALQ